MTSEERYSQAAESNVCPDCGRQPVTRVEVAIIVGYTAVVSVLSIAAFLAFVGVGR